MKILRENRAAAALVILAAGFLALGLWRGEAEVVLRKAATVCMECIGLG